jgi:hypothetical protein
MFSVRGEKHGWQWMGIDQVVFRPYMGDTLWRNSKLLILDLEVAG